MDKKKRGYDDMYGAWNLRKRVASLMAGLCRLVWQGLVIGAWGRSLLGAMVVTTGLVLSAMPAPAEAAIVASDDFSSGGYSGGSGWTGSWTETTTNGNNPAASCFSNPSYICTTSGYLRFHGVPGPDPYIYRQIDLSDPTIASASLIFDLSTAGSLSGVDAFTVQISNDGGSSWTELQQYNNDQNLTDATFDISAYMASNTQIRFGVANYTLNPGQYFEIDNARIDVQYNPAFAPANDFAITDPDTNINLTVLDNDGTDVDASSVTFPTQSAGTVSGGGSILTVPNEGVYTVQGDGSITFDPDPDFTGRSTPVTYQVSNTGGTSTNTATVQVLIDERALCVPSDPNNIGYALASAGDNTAGTPRVYVVEISDPGAGTNPGNAQLLFDHNVIAAAQNGDGDPSNDIPYLGSAPTGAPAPDPSVVPVANIGNGYQRHGGRFQERAPLLHQ